MTDEKPVPSDELSLQRTVMASTRTFMAWTRTALSLISFGFSIPKILEYANTERFGRMGETGPQAMGTILIFLGVFVLVASGIEHGRLVNQIQKMHRNMKFTSTRLSYLVAVVLTILGVLALVNIAFHVGPL